MKKYKIKIAKKEERSNTIIWDSGFEALKAAIVLQAFEDYKNPKKAKCSRRSIERFFKSTWCASLINIDPDKLIGYARSLISD